MRLLLGYTPERKEVGFYTEDSNRRPTVLAINTWDKSSLAQRLPYLFRFGTAAPFGILSLHSDDVRFPDQARAALALNATLPLVLLINHACELSVLFKYFPNIAGIIHINRSGEMTYVKSKDGFSCTLLGQ